ncbi:transcriptional regulator, ArsR family [Marinobacter daqiaonensis]|uniref:Transcriptional regulator, ArsR family n=1 Tax=Marinobacter daqiaonensis TaxID=650891 RepID=A0A1I6HMN0_9GAMM|nr:metalloregulator ArsR/SmtB family transcription factor [Marinobacter daqiaonensis]SFR55705.1 transcriptional regulator, ArsR family [Marinobacter daqiaonensis]
MTSLTTTTPHQGLDALAPLYKACGDPLRLEILRVLRRDTFGVLELSQLFDMRQSGMSHHLKVLHKAGLLEPQREGNAIFYRRPLHLESEAAGLPDAAVRQIFQTIDRVPVTGQLQERIEAIRQQRADQSQVFFARHAEQFREQQELIAAFDLYAQPTAELIQARAARNHWRTALEIGPGEGAFLPVLADICERVVAVDNSADMLRKARQTCEELRLDSVELIEGTTAALKGRPERFDLVVANMVLHHLPSPADVFLEGSELLRPGGYLVISDLRSHDQDWARENCGDLWLGFEPEELNAWAADAGLETGESLFIGLRNGFQVQVREFRKPENTAREKNPGKNIKSF